MSVNAEVKVVLDPTTGVIYRCRPKPRRFRGLEKETTITLTAFCSINFEKRILWVGYLYLDSFDDRFEQLISEQSPPNLMTVFQAMMILDCLEVVTPYTPARILSDIQEGNQTGLGELIGGKNLVQILRTTPPRFDVTSAFVDAGLGAFTNATFLDDTDWPSQPSAF